MGLGDVSECSRFASGFRSLSVISTMLIYGSNQIFLHTCSEELVIQATNSMGKKGVGRIFGGVSGKGLFITAYEAAGLFFCQPRTASAGANLSRASIAWRWVPQSHRFGCVLVRVQCLRSRLRVS
jgi:hypothetical protein